MRSSPDSTDPEPSGSPTDPAKPQVQDAPRPRTGKYGRKAGGTPPGPKLESKAVLPVESMIGTGKSQLSAALGQYDTLAGTIVSAHGVQGTLKVKPATETAVSLFVPTGGKRVAIWIGPASDTGSVYQIVSAKRQEPKNIYLVHVDTVHDRTMAETLVGQSLFAPSERRVPLADEEYYVSDLVGLDVVDARGISLGKLTDVHRSPAHDVYETDQDILIPAVKAFVERVDLAAGKLIVHDANHLRMAETIEGGAVELE